MYLHRMCHGSLVSLVRESEKGGFGVILQYVIPIRFRLVVRLPGEVGPGRVETACDALWLDALASVWVDVGRLQRASGGEAGAFALSRAHCRPKQHLGFLLLDIVPNSSKSLRT